MRTFAVALIASTTLAVQWGQNTSHTHYKDIKINKPYTVDNSTYKTITNKKTRQQPRYITEKRTDTVYDDVEETQQRPWLETSFENRPQEVKSTSYSTSPAQGDK